MPEISDVLVSISLATIAVRNLHSSKTAGVDEIQPKMLKALDKIEDEWLKHASSMLHGNMEQCFWAGKLGWWSQGTRECALIMVESCLCPQPPKESLCQGFREDLSNRTKEGFT